MKLTKWKIRDKVIQLPTHWNKTNVLNFINTDIKVCEYCSKIDISIEHYPNCNPIQEQQRQESLYYKY